MTIPYSASEQSQGSQQQQQQPLLGMQPLPLHHIQSQITCDETMRFRPMSPASIGLAHAPQPLDGFRPLTREQQGLPPVFTPRLVKEQYSDNNSAFDRIKQRAQTLFRAFLISLFLASVGTVLNIAPKLPYLAAASMGMQFMGLVVLGMLVSLFVRELLKRVWLKETIFGNTVPERSTVVPPVQQAVFTNSKGMFPLQAREQQYQEPTATVLISSSPGNRLTPVAMRPSFKPA